MPPRMYVGMRETNALRVLRLCACDEGAYFALRHWLTFNKAGDHTIAENLVHHALVERRRSGPRGGWRFHATELGRRVLDVLDSHTDPATGLQLLGLPREMAGDHCYSTR